MHRLSVGRRVQDINHPSHHHPLHEWDLGTDINRPEIICRGCNRDSADVYCPEEGCEYFLHTFCSDLGRLNNYSHVDHPLHPQHPLTCHFDSFPNDQTEFVCSFCKETKTSGCFLLHCAHCDFYLDFYCALNFELNKTLFSQYQFPHFLHPYHSHNFSPYHPLDFGFKSACRACGLKIGYNELVLKCSGLNCMYYLHVHCFRLPKKMKHPLHPQHTLTLLEGPQLPKVDPKVDDAINLAPGRHISSTRFHCNACQHSFTNKFVLHCKQCPEFNLDIGCAYINPNFKFDGHDHLLAYIDSYRGLRDRCAVCNALFGFRGKVYRCVDCNFNVHKACLSLPLSVDYEDHVHPFTLITSLNEDEDGKYYCDVCEERREPNHGLYCCVECGPSFVAHFECVLPPSYTEGNPPWMSNFPRVIKLMAESRALFLATAGENQLISKLDMKIEKMREMLKQLLDERHRENVTEKLDKLEKSNAEAEGHYYLINHPLQPQHPLNPRLDTNQFECSFCGKTTTYQFFHCARCDFYLDLFCYHFFRDVFRDKLRDYYFQHFLHGPETSNYNIISHHLSPCAITRSNGDFNNICEGCGLHIPIGSFVFNCLAQSCRSYFLHVKCSQVPKEMNHPFHPQHSLTLLQRVPHQLDSSQDLPCFCSACCKRIDDFRFFLRCSDCNFNLDILCSFRKADVKCHHHEDHDLLYLHDTADPVNEFLCSVCNTLSDAADFYRCVECNVNIHPGCLSLPTEVNSDFHVHPFILTSSIKEGDDHDDSRTYYCDICEERRDPAHATYSSQECHLDAHFKCVLPPESIPPLTFLPREPEHDLYYLSNKEIERKGEIITTADKALLQNVISELSTEMTKMREVESIVHLKTSLHKKLEDKLYLSSKKIERKGEITTTDKAFLQKAIISELNMEMAKIGGVVIELHKKVQSVEVTEEIEQLEESHAKAEKEEAEQSGLELMREELITPPASPTVGLQEGKSPSERFSRFRSLQEIYEVTKNQDDLTLFCLFATCEPVNFQEAMEDKN
ncbi:hypothetical protein FEM48_Zijuj10G0012300 [Ziziphus jujuba var. spinosa]|uniref:Phorbol-ester/DAG-type domain-containing protein n=1 Tax=Ziziphus jujuba var. spinosa TaxID=714518 RepID=A0A978UKF0_ZIZJJ|nr:hypothetical protein FEM48_Zijuj10G0012300 [Ziziphus jujuba var. spinosa]